MTDSKSKSNRTTVNMIAGITAGLALLGLGGFAIYHTGYDRSNIWQNKIVQPKEWIDNRDWTQIYFHDGTETNVSERLDESQIKDILRANPKKAGLRRDYQTGRVITSGGQYIE